MSIESALAAGRRAAEARMLSSATVHRRAGAPSTDARGLEVPGWIAVFEDYPCRIAGMARSQSPSKTVDIGGTQVQVATRTAHFPHDTDLNDGDLIEVTVGELAGSVWQVVEADGADQQTARRVPVIATTRPEEW